MGTKLSELNEDQFSLERDIHRLVENNLEILFGLEYVRSEFELHGLRIDTLGFDKESNAFVILEYKRDKNFSVVDQGVAYLNLMLNNKAEFILEYNQKFSPGLKREDVDWSQSRIIFIAPEFTKYQQHAVGFKEFGIQLWEAHRYKNGLLVLNEVKPLEAKESITTITKSASATKRISEEIKIYTEERLLKNGDSKSRGLYSELKTAILSLGNDIEVRPTKMYISFRRKFGFVGIIILKSKLKTYLNIDVSELTDPLKKARDVKKIGHYSHGDSEVVITESKDIPYLLELIRQAYQKN